VKRRPGSELACFSLSEAAAKLCVSKDLVQALIHLVFLSDVMRGEVQYVVADSLKEFEEQFIAPKALSRKFNLTVEELQQALEILQVPTLQFPIGDGDTVQEIIDRRFESKIKAYLTNSSNASNAGLPSLNLERLAKERLGQYQKRVAHSELKQAPQTWVVL